MFLLLSGPCGFFQIQENSRRRGLRFMWSAEFKSGSVSSAHTDDLKNLNQSLSDEKQRRIRIGPKYVKPGATYTIIVRVYDDAFNQMAKDSVDIKRVIDHIPKVLFFKRKLTIKTSTKLKLRGKSDGTNATSILA